MAASQFDANSDPRPTGLPDEARTARPFLGIQFKCCRTYGRIYRNDSRTAYEGRCPKCLAKIAVPIGGSGSSSRFFSAG